jgi:hypothetical protein
VTPDTTVISFEESVRQLVREEIEAAKITLADRPWTVNQVAEYFQVSHTTVHDWRRCRDSRLRLRMYNIGSGEERGIYRVDREEVERFKRERGL